MYHKGGITGKQMSQSARTPYKSGWRRSRARGPHNSEHLIRASEGEVVGPVAGIFLMQNRETLLKVEIVIQ